MQSKSIFLENQILFRFETDTVPCFRYIGIVNILIEWESYQEERFCEILYASIGNKGQKGQNQVKIA